MNLTQYLECFDIQNGDLDELQRRLDDEWTSGNPQSHQKALVDLLDRVGEDGGLCGVDWSILHGLESLNNHNESVLENWQPTYWRKLMLQRIAKSGVTRINGELISDYLT